MKKIVLSVLMLCLMATLIQTCTAQTIQGTSDITATNIQVYSDETCTETLTTIDWGTMAPNENKTVPVYIRALENSNVTVTYTSNNTDAIFHSTELGIVTANTTKQANFTLTIAETALEGAFTLNITLTGDTSVIPELPFALPAILLIATVTTLTIYAKKRQNQHA